MVGQLAMLFFLRNSHEVCCSVRVSSPPPHSLRFVSTSRVIPFFLVSACLACFAAGFVTHY
jgi:hypothetical protein